MRYTFTRDHEQQHAVRTLRQVLKVYRSGYYAWKQQPRSVRSLENQRLTCQIKQSWLQSGAVYGDRKVHADLCDLGERCGEQRVYRLMNKRDCVSSTVIAGFPM